jgi:hypothetical protein
MHLPRGSRPGRSNRRVDEGEAEGAALQFPAEKFFYQRKSATGDHVKRAVATMPKRGGNHAKSRVTTMQKRRWQPWRTYPYLPHFNFCGHVSCLLAELVDPRSSDPYCTIPAHFPAWPVFAGRPAGDRHLHGGRELCAAHCRR